MIRLVNLEKAYRNEDVETTALQGINMEIRAGEFVSIMGPSGSGKSTLLHILGLLDTPSRGQYFLMGEDTAKFSNSRRAFLRRQHIGFVFQHFNLIEDLTVEENIELPLLYQQVPERDRRMRVEKSMLDYQVAHKRKMFPQQLSGGQQQRVALARATITTPALLLADEPTGNLNSALGQEILDIFGQLNEAGTTIIMVTHSQTAASYSQRTIHLFDGQVVSEQLSS